jgi:hypothetical protein
LYQKQVRLNLTLPENPVGEGSRRRQKP